MNKMNIKPLATVLILPAAMRKTVGDYHLTRQREIEGQCARNGRGWTSRHQTFAEILALELGN